MAIVRHGHWALTYLNSFESIVLSLAVSAFVGVMFLPAFSNFRSFSVLSLNGDVLGENISFGVCGSFDGDADRKLSETLLLDLKRTQTNSIKLIHILIGFVTI